MVDIAVTWDNQNARGDWSIVNGDLKSGSELETAIIVSLFTDRIAPIGAPIPGGDTDPRGWWGDDFSGYDNDETGSLFWLYRRAKKSGNSNPLVLMQKAAADALQWAIDDGVVSWFQITAEYLSVGSSMLGITIIAGMPTGGTQIFRYATAWTGT